MCASTKVFSKTSLPVNYIFHWFQCDSPNFWWKLVKYTNLVGKTNQVFWFKMSVYIFNLYRCLSSNCSMVSTIYQLNPHTHQHIVIEWSNCRICQLNSTTMCPLILFKFSIRYDYGNKFGKCARKLITLSVAHIFFSISKSIFIALRAAHAESNFTIR
jgi:hypothetical protein